MAGQALGLAGLCCQLRVCLSRVLSVLHGWVLGWAGGRVAHGDEVEIEHGLDRIDDRVDRVVATQPKLLLRQPAERAPRHAALRALAIPQGQ